ncbi:MAG: DUF1631 domain-containing protein, partial [Burkholderiaceae bacterium]|nr:DUF1631 domain-containing protein [Burkholderiaceae bacterium]
MSDIQTYAPRPIQLPAVLQIAGRAPFFGMIASMSEQGLAFDFHTGAPAQQTVGSTAILDFNFLGQHHSCNALFIHVQGGRALLSLRDASPAVLAALHAVNRHNAPPLASSLSVLQRQHACHTRFMDGMKAVVNDFYQRLPGEIEKRSPQAAALTDSSGFAKLQGPLTQLRPTLTQQFTVAYPMYPEQRASYAASRTLEPSLDLVDMDRVDDWIRRTTIAQRIDDAITPLPHEFNRHYNALLKNDYKQLAHPYQPDSVLNVLADLIAPLGLDTDQRIFCYDLMGQALEKHAGALYPAMIQVLGVVPNDILPAPNAEASLAKWLETSAQTPDTEAPRSAATAEQVGELAALLARLTHNLDALGMGQADSVTEARHAAEPVIPALLAHDRIMARYLPATPSLASPGDSLLASPESPAAASAFGK